MQLFFLFSIVLGPLCLFSFNEEMLVDGHSVYITKTADETHAWKLRLIREAKSSVEISAGYCWGYVFEELLQAIHLKLEQNPTIKIHFMAIQIVGLIADTHFSFLSALEAQYPGRFHFLITDTNTFLNYDGKTYFAENHTKIIIVDEKYFLIGGTNTCDRLSTQDVNKYPDSDSLATEFLPKASCDMDAIISGPIAKNIRKDFFNLYSLYETEEPLEQTLGDYAPKEIRYFPVQEKSSIALFENDAETTHNAKVYATIAGPRINLHTIGNMHEFAIHQANQSIDLGHMYFFPRPSIYQALLDAINRDVAFSLVTNGTHEGFSVSNSSRSFFAYINHTNYFPIMSGRHYRMWEAFDAKEAAPKNSRIFELDLEGVLYHKKVMVVDNRYAIVGNYNLGMKSENAAHEAAALIDSPSAALKVKKVLLHDQSLSREIPYIRAMGWYFNPFYSILDAFERKFFDGVIL